MLLAVAVALVVVHSALFHSCGDWGEAAITGLAQVPIVPCFWPPGAYCTICSVLALDPWQPASDE